MENYSTHWQRVLPISELWCCPPAYQSYLLQVSTVSLLSSDAKNHIKHILVSYAGNIGSAAVEGSQQDSARASLAMRGVLLEFQHAIGAPGRCPFPVIVAVHGSVIGLGVDMISACDIRYAASDASFSIKVSMLLEFCRAILMYLAGGRHWARPRHRNAGVPAKDHW